MLRLTAEAEANEVLDDGTLVHDPLDRDPGEWLWDDDEYGYGAWSRSRRAWRHPARSASGAANISSARHRARVRSSRLATCG